MLLPPPLTAPLAQLWWITGLAELLSLPLAPTNPPARLKSPTVTAPAAPEFKMVPNWLFLDRRFWPSPGVHGGAQLPSQALLLAARPPAWLLSPARTAPVAKEFLIMPPLSPTRPPT